MKYFDEATRMSSHRQVDALLAYWLFCLSESTQRWSTFFLVSVGTVVGPSKKLALAPWYLALFMHIWTSPRRMSPQSVSRYDMVNYANRNFLQLFLWEGFQAFSSIPREFKAIKPQMINGVEDKDSHLKPEGRRCYEVTWPEAPRKPLWQVIDEKGNYNFRPYAYTLLRVLTVPFYAQSSKVTSLKSRSSVPSDLQILLAMITPTMLPLRSGKGETLITCNPLRLLRHLGFHQGAVWVTGRSCISVWDGESHYVGEGQ